MNSLQCLAFLGAAAILANLPAGGQVPARVRGTVIALDGDTVTIKERDGRQIKLALGAFTTYAYVVPASLNAIKVKDFVGSAVKGPLGNMVAVELAIIPEDMTQGRISLYDWDPLPDPTAESADNAAPNGQHGTLSGVSPRKGELAKTRMTNGIVSEEKLSADRLKLRVTYDRGSRSFSIGVPLNAPIVRYALSDRAALAIGTVVMIKTNRGNRAGLITVGKGIDPPM